jgi:hypothetical protein
VHAAPPQSLVLVIVTVKLVHLVLGVVEVVENDPDKTSSNERGDCQANVHPLNLGVDQYGVESLRDGGSESVGKEVHGLHERLHGRRSLGVRVLKTSDGGEDFRDTNEHVCTSLSGNVNVVAVKNTVGTPCGLAVGVIVARAGLVDVVLDDGGIDHSERGYPETGDDTVDRREGDLLLAQEWHKHLVDEWQENDNSDGVEVLHQIVGNTVGSHLSTLGDEVIRELAVDDPVNRVEAEDLAGNESALDFLNKVIVPSENSSLSEPGLVRRLRAVQFACLDHEPHDAESISDNRALRRSNNVNLASENKDQRTDEKDAQTEQEGRPEVNVALHVRGGEQRKTSDVDAEVENHVNPLNGDRRVDDDLLAGFVIVSNNHTPPLVLVRNERCNVRFDSTSSKTNNNDGYDETSKAGAVIQSRGDRCAGEDEKTDHVDTTEDDNGVVLAEVLISDNGTCECMLADRTIGVI